MAFPPILIECFLKDGIVWNYGLDEKAFKVITHGLQYMAFVSALFADLSFYLSVTPRMILPPFQKIRCIDILQVNHSNV